MIFGRALTPSCLKGGGWRISMVWTISRLWWISVKKSNYLHSTLHLGWKWCSCIQHAETGGQLSQVGKTGWDDDSLNPNQTEEVWGGRWWADGHSGGEWCWKRIDGVWWRSWRRQRGGRGRPEASSRKTVFLRAGACEQTLGKWWIWRKERCNASETGDIWPIRSWVAGAAPCKGSAEQTHPGQRRRSGEAEVQRKLVWLQSKISWAEVV